MSKFGLKFCLAAMLLLFGSMSAAQELVLEDLEGGRIALASLSGKWVFINYWATWCGPCVEEIAELNHFYHSKYADKIAVFAVNFDTHSLAKQRRLAQAFAIQYPSLNPKSLHALHLDNISVVPVTYVFDPNGQLNTTLYGGQTEQTLREVLVG